MATAKHYRDDELRLPAGEWKLKGNVRVYEVAPVVVVEKPKQNLGGRPKAACGQISAYRRHLREKTPVCDACREAERSDGAKRRAQKKKRKREAMTPFQRLAAECTPYGQKRKAA